MSQGAHRNDDSGVRALTTNSVEAGEGPLSWEIHRATGEAKIPNHRAMEVFEDKGLKARTSVDSRSKARERHHSYPMQNVR